MGKGQTCKCGNPLTFTDSVPVWVYCEEPSCDYVVMYGDWQIDRIYKTYSENKFWKSGPKKGWYRGSPVSIHITDIKKNFRWGR
ncbi:hypothetical protein [Bacillus sp. 1P06AnD]|uniref:hypothetical protein n=1 Tax=Bacillus sp. 1P06AnD TaxID=3132208 RepID=UPI0039A0CAEF